MKPVNRAVEIVIQYPESLLEKDKIYFLAYGIEEEGLPFKLISSDQSKSHKNADEASMQSGLDIGIGIGSDWQLSIRNSRNEKSLYLFDVRGERDIDLKAYGANAARLIKGIPFREITGG